MNQSISIIHIERGLILSVNTVVIPIVNNEYNQTAIAKAEECFLKLIRLFSFDLTTEDEYDLIEEGYYSDDNGTEIIFRWSDETT